MLCGKCSHPNPDENKFCGNCGTSLPPVEVISLKDLVDAGILRAGDELSISVKGKDVAATLLADGKLKYQEQTYDAPLACAAALRGQVCDSWYCWEAVDHITGRKYPISHFRGALRRKRGEVPPSPR
ncbi:MAG: zinc ribbon domain-containing protein [Dehalococcoidales bacterium]|nr:zinc ribbon domain-containing protein [Dehalococcoidales bacterium]